MLCPLCCCGQPFLLVRTSFIDRFVKANFRWNCAFSSPGPAPSWLFQNTHQLRICWLRYRLTPMLRSIQKTKRTCTRIPGISNRKVGFDAADYRSTCHSHDKQSRTYVDGLTSKSDARPNGPDTPCAWKCVFACTDEQTCLKSREKADNATLRYVNLVKTDLTDVTVNLDNAVLPSGENRGNKEDKYAIDRLQPYIASKTSSRWPDWQPPQVWESCWHYIGYRVARPRQRWWTVCQWSSKHFGHARLISTNNWWTFGPIWNG